MRRLFVQIYVTIIGSLVIVVILSGLAWNLFARDRIDRDMSEVVSNLAYLALPHASEPAATQQAAVDRLGDGLDIDLSLFDAQRRPIASSGPASVLPDYATGARRWQRTRRAHVWILQLPDERWLVANLERRAPNAPFARLILFLGAIALGVAIGAYPLVRRLTRRLEALQSGVEAFGRGDLETRVSIRGRDEVASLANGFNDAAERIQSLLQSHRMLLANASHELRTPLSRIRLGIEMLRGGDPDRRAALERDIAELDELIDEILLMTRLDVSGEADRSELIDLVALIAEETSRFSGVELKATFASVRGDPRLLRRMIRNLVDNAHLHGAPPIIVHLETSDQSVFLTITDGGTGIDEANRENIFKPFFRAADRQNHRGYGLGLPLVRQIAEAHGGFVELLITAGTGTAFRVRLPLADSR